MTDDPQERGGATGLTPLNMHGHANTWEEELLEVAAERDQLKAQLAERDTQIAQNPPIVRP